MLFGDSPDFTVKLWDLFHGVLIHTFAVHGGGVKNIVTCPPEINVSKLFIGLLISAYVHTRFIGSLPKIAIVDTLLGGGEQLDSNHRSKIGLGAARQNTVQFHTPTIAKVFSILCVSLISIMCLQKYQSLTPFFGGKGLDIALHC